MKIVIFAMLFNGGVIPLFMVVSKLHLNNTIWSLVLPGAVPVFNVILLINFLLRVFQNLLMRQPELMEPVRSPFLLKVYLPIFTSGTGNSWSVCNCKSLE